MFFNMKNKTNKGITLIALVITIIVLLILAGFTILALTGENGILGKSQKASEETNKQTATEKINLKITNSQIETYTQKQRMPTLKELSLSLGKDKEISYVTEKSQKIADTKYDVPSENPTSIYTKLTEYPYEFEIGDSLRLLSIDNIKLADTEISIPDGYIKPSGTKTINANGTYPIANYENVDVNVPTYETNSLLKITEKNPKIDVSNYQYVDTSALFTANEMICKKFTQTFPTSGNTMTIDLGYIPQFIFLKTTTKNNNLLDFYSFDFCNTFYRANRMPNNTDTISAVNSFKKVEQKIIFTVNTLTNWNDVPIEIYAIK